MLGIIVIAVTGKRVRPFGFCVGGPFPHAGRSIGPGLCVACSFHKTVGKEIVVTLQACARY